MIWDQPGEHVGATWKSVNRTLSSKLVNVRSARCIILVIVITEITVAQIIRHDDHYIGTLYLAPVANAAVNASNKVK